jgi:predicted ATPase
MIAIDDARWADAASLRFVTYLAAQLEGLPALALLAVAANRGARGGRAAGGAIRGG